MTKKRQGREDLSDGSGFRAVFVGERDPFVLLSAQLILLNVPLGEARSLAEKARREESEAKRRRPAA